MTKFKFAFNPAAAYREHGKRYAIYVGAELMFVLSCLAIALLSLWGGFHDVYASDFAYAAAFLMIKVAFVCFIYLLFENIYWKIRFARIQRRNVKGLTNSSAKA